MADQPQIPVDPTDSPELVGPAPISEVTQSEIEVPPTSEVTQPVTEPLATPEIPESAVEPPPVAQPLPGSEPAPNAPKAPLIETQADIEKKAQAIIKAPTSIKWLPILIVIILLLLLGGGAVAGMTLYKDKLPAIPFLAKPTPTQAPIPTVIPTPTPTPDPTADWKTFTNSKYSYSIKVPQEWGILGGMSGEIDIAKTSSDANTVLFGLKHLESTLNIKVQEVKSSDFNSWFSEYVKDYREFPPTAKSIKIGNFSGYEITYTASEGGCEGDYAIFNEGRIYQFIRPGGTCQIDKKTYEQILSTFKFLEVPSNISNWKTYINNQYKYSIKYPDGWSVRDSGGLAQISNTNKFDFGDSDPKSLTINIQILEEKDFDPLSYNYKNQKTNITIDGKVVSKDLVTSVDEGLGMVLAYFIKDNKYYGFSASPTNSNLINYFDQIVSTFKFTN